MKKYINKISTVVSLGLIVCLYNCGSDEPVVPINNAPVISSQSFFIDENSPVNTSVGIIIASDQDQDMLSFSIVSGNTNNAFDLNSSTGEITVSVPSALDFETTSTFQLFIEAADEIDSNQAIITINLNDVNEDSNTRAFAFTFGNDNYGIIAGAIENYGASDPSESGSITHYNYDIIITDGKITSVTEDGETYPEYSDFSIAIYVELFAQGTTGFDVGTFTYQDENTGGFSDDFFSDLQIWLDKNGNETVDEGDVFYGAIAGHITITEESDTYVLDYSVTVANEENVSDQKTLIGKYAGAYEFYNLTN